MRDRIPERLRSDPRVMQESMRLLLSGVLRTTNDAIMHDRSHPIFVPELNICQNIFQPNADTIYKAALIEKGGTYRIRGDRGTTRMVILAQLGPDTLRMISTTCISVPTEVSMSSSRRPGLPAMRATGGS